MSTIVNTPTTGGDSSVAVLLVGILFTGAIIALFFIYGLPAILSMTKSASTPSTIEVKLPLPTEMPTRETGATTAP